MNIASDIVYFILEFLSYKDLCRLKSTSQLFCAFANSVCKKVSILSDRWAWANERLKLHQNVTTVHTKIYDYSLFLQRIGMTVNFCFEHDSLVLRINSFFGTFVKVKICCLDSNKWWCETPKCSFIPARLNTRNRDMDAIICTLNSVDHKTKNVLVDLSDPGDIYVLYEEAKDENTFVHISECSFIMLSNISILKHLALQCDSNLWSLRFESSEHPECDNKRWSMIRTSQGYYFIYIFENNVQVSKNVLLKSYPGQGNLRSVDAGRYVINMKHDGEIRILDNVNNSWIYFNQIGIKFTKIIESYCDGKSLIVIRDSTSGVFLISTSQWKLEQLEFCKPNGSLPLYFDHKNKKLHWIDFNDVPHCKCITHDW